MRPGSLAVVLEPSAAGSASLTIVAEVTDATLELSVGSAAETAALVEELVGQPEVEQILQGSAEGDVDGKEASDVDVEMADDGGASENAVDTS